MPACLTIDDAPSASLGEKLDALDAHSVPAVLFCEGRRLERHPDLAERTVRAGVHLGNHTYSHPQASRLSAAAFEDEVARTEHLVEALYDRTGVERPARLFRFPYGDDGGERAAAFQGILRERGFTGPAGVAATGAGRARRVDWPWTVSVEDWTTDDVAEPRARFEAALDRASRGERHVVLFHDAGNSPALFDAFVEWLAESDLALADPLELLR